MGRGSWILCKWIGGVKMKQFKVEVIQTNYFYIEAHSEEEAKQIASEDYIWDENQTPPNYYNVRFEVFEETKND